MSRRLRLLPLVTLMLIALLVSSGLASAAQLDLVEGSSPSPYQTWADDSYAPTYPGAVQLALSRGLLTCGTSGSAAGCTSWSGSSVPRVDIDGGEGSYLAHNYLMHELGHVFDVTEMQDQFRARFMAVWGLPGGAGAWWTPFAGGHASAGEWFAESYRLCALYGPQVPYQAWLTDAPSYGFPGARDFTKQDASCGLILSAGTVAGLPAPSSPVLYSPRLVVTGNRKAAECRGADLLALGKPVRCQKVGGGAPAGPWTVTLQSRRLTSSQLRRARLTAVGWRPAFQT